jgi:hypothetical protein
MIFMRYPVARAKARRERPANSLAASLEASMRTPPRVWPHALTQLLGVVAQQTPARTIRAATG